MIPKTKGFRNMDRTLLNTGITFSATVALTWVALEQFGKIAPRVGVTFAAIFAISQLALAVLADKNSELQLATFAGAAFIASAVVITLANVPMMTCATLVGITSFFLSSSYGVVHLIP